MDKNKIHGFMDHLNLFFVGLVICMELPLGFSLKPISKHKG